MSDFMISVEKLAKKYRIGHRRETTLRGALTGAARGFFNRLRAFNSEFSGNKTDDFWALRDVSFEVKEGETLAIMGRNGAGKSTLLKVLSRITEPTEGRIRLRGRMASLLEVGTGFHPEMTGRENVFLNGAILGMKRVEMVSKFDAIVAFAEVEKFIDTPVKHYSSGMYMRLAFSVAAHLEPEILVIDEVLSVGDAAFQKKCLGKMGDVSRAGRTVLFVSHNMAAVSQLCTRGLVLSEGRVVKDANVAEALAFYTSANREARTEAWSGSAGDDTLRLLATEIKSASGALTTDAELKVSAEIEVLKPVDGLVFGYRIFNEMSAVIAYVLYDDNEPSLPPTVQPGKLRRTWTIPANTLAAGTYRIGFALGIHMQRAVVLNTAGTLEFLLENTAGLGRRFATKGGDNEGVFRPNWSVE